MNTTMSDPESEIRALKAKVDKLESEKRDIQKTLVDGMEVGPHAEIPLEKVKDDILLFLSKQGERRCTADEVARYLRLKPQIALHHLTTLDNEVMVLRGGRVRGPPSWKLADKGLEYLVANKFNF